MKSIENGDGFIGGCLKQNAKCSANMEWLNDGYGGKKKHKSSVKSTKKRTASKPKKRTASKTKKHVTKKRGGKSSVIKQIVNGLSNADGPYTSTGVRNFTDAVRGIRSVNSLPDSEIPEGLWENTAYDSDLMANAPTGYTGVTRSVPRVGLNALRSLSQEQTQRFANQLRNSRLSSRFSQQAQKVKSDMLSRPPPRPPTSGLRNELEENFGNDAGDLAEDVGEDFGLGKKKRKSSVKKPKTKKKTVAKKKPVAKKRKSTKSKKGGSVTPNAKGGSFLSFFDDALNDALDGVDDIIPGSKQFLKNNFINPINNDVLKPLANDFGFNNNNNNSAPKSKPQSQVINAAVAGAPAREKTQNQIRIQEATKRLNMLKKEWKKVMNSFVTTHKKIEMRNHNVNPKDKETVKNLTNYLNTNKKELEDRLKLGILNAEIAEYNGAVDFLKREHPLVGYGKKRKASSTKKQKIVKKRKLLKKKGGLKKHKVTKRKPIKRRVTKRKTSTKRRVTKRK